MGQNISCLVIGAGWMAQEYLKAAQHVSGLKMTFYAPSEKNRAAIEVLGGKLFTDLNLAFSETKPTHAIVASSVDSLPQVTLNLLEMKLKNILVEKPAFIDLPTGKRLSQATAQAQANVFVAYNRRFYAAATKALEMMKNNDETFKGIQFEFTELASDVAGSEKFPANVKEKWALANSSHVIDFAFFCVGLPQMDKSLFVQNEKLPWHASAAQMMGAGLTDQNIPFSYSAYWGGVGRWSVEWITDKTRYIFRPMEKLQVQRLGTFNYEEIPLESCQAGTKHGLVDQLKAFIWGTDKEKLLSIHDSVEVFNVIAAMAGYPAE